MMWFFIFTQVLAADWLKWSPLTGCRCCIGSGENWAHRCVCGRGYTEKITADWQMQHSDCVHHGNDPPVSNAVQQLVCTKAAAGPHQQVETR